MLGLLSKMRVILFPERVWTILPDMMPSILVADWAFLPLSSFLASSNVGQRTALHTQVCMTHPDALCGPTLQK